MLLNAHLLNFPFVIIFYILMSHLRAHAQQTSTDKVNNQENKNIVCELNKIYNKNQYLKKLNTVCNVMNYTQQ